MRQILLLLLLLLSCMSQESSAFVSPLLHRSTVTKIRLQMKLFSPTNIQQQQQQDSNSSSRKNKNANQLLISSLKQIYMDTVLPMERKFDLHSTGFLDEIKEAELDARPMVLLIGQYSTGKTTFIRHLLGEHDFPGMHIGPEPTTDKYMALIHGEDDDGNEEETVGKNNKDEKKKKKNRDDITTTTSLNATETSIKEEDGTTPTTPRTTTNDDDTTTTATIPKTKTTRSSAKGKIMDTGAINVGKTIKGNSLTVMPELPFATLSQFGSSFLNNFVGSITNAPLLKSVTLVDTPGVLSGEKQRLNRSYDFAQTTKWFADRSDLILLLFDADKLDISDELKEVVTTIRLHNNDKIRCVLNKADGISREQLVRVYGSLLWSMGKLFPNPEVVRVYVGSFWDEPLVHDDFEEMFASDESLLVQELINLPDCAAERKVNAMVQRIRLVKVYLCLLDHLRRQSRRMIPPPIRKEATRRRLLSNLSQILEDVQIKYDLPKGDMPNVEEFRSQLEEIDNFATLPKVNRRLLRKLDELILQTIPTIMEGNVGITGQP